MAFEFVAKALAQRRSQNLLRARHCIDVVDGCLIQVDGQSYLNFSSNDYLGMGRSQLVAQAWVDGLSQYGSGSGAAPLVTGHTRAHQVLEEYLAEQLKREKVLLFNSGFAANQAICHALFKPGPTQHSGQIIADKLMHASFQEAAQSSSAQFKRFKHNDLEHLQQIMQGAIFKDRLVATEGVFSMDGDQAPLSQLLSSTQSSGAWLMVDDAHGFGVLGQSGLGVVDLHDLSQQQVPILMATLGKAIGTAGAFVAGSADFIDYLTNFAGHYIYSTAMPAAQAYATLASLQSSLRIENQHILQLRIAQFRGLAKQARLPLMLSDTAIQPILVGDSQRALAISQHLKRLGLWVTAIRYPTVPKNTARLRITLCAEHQEADILALVDALQLVNLPLNNN